MKERIKVIGLHNVCTKLKKNKCRNKWYLKPTDWRNCESLEFRDYTQESHSQNSAWVICLSIKIPLTWSPWILESCLQIFNMLWLSILTQQWTSVLVTSSTVFLSFLVLTPNTKHLHPTYYLRVHKSAVHQSTQLLISQLHYQKRVCVCVCS